MTTSILYVIQLVTNSISAAHTIQRNWLGTISSKHVINSEREQHCHTIRSKMQGWWQIPGSNCTYGLISNHKHTHPHGKTEHINCTEYARLYESTWRRWEMNAWAPSHQPWATEEDESSASLSSLTADESQASLSSVTARDQTLTSILSDRRQKFGFPLPWMTTV